MNFIELSFYSLTWLVIIYIFNCVLANKIIKPEPMVLLLYSSCVALLGIYGEVLVGTVYESLFGIKLWEYRLLPIHDAYTSVYSLFVWSFYGFHLYLLHSSLNEKKERSATFLALLLGVEAMILEVLFNVSYLFITGAYIFYYFPNDIFHLTSVQALPIYIVAGYLIPRAIRKMRDDPRSFILLNYTLIFIFIFLT